MNKVCVKMVIIWNAGLVFFFCYLEAFSTKSFQFFPFGILEIIHFKLALFATTKKELLILEIR